MSSEPGAPGLAGARRRAGPALLRAAVTVAILGGLLAWLPTDALFAAMLRAGAGTWLIVLAGFAAGHALAALKWRTLLTATGVHAPVREVLRAHGAGLFANLCLPSLVGGDVLRSGMLAGRGRRIESLAVAGVGDRVLDTAALVALSAIGALWIPGELDSGVARLLGAAALLLCLGVLAAAAVLRLAPASRLPGPLAGIAAKLRVAFDALASRPGVAARALALSFAIQGGFVALNAYLGGAVGIELPLAVWLLAWPLAKLSALLPISLGGIGVREAALAALLAPFAVEPALAVAQSLLWETVLIALGLLAGAASLWMGPRLRAGSVATAGGAR